MSADMALLTCDHCQLHISTDRGDMSEEYAEVICKIILRFQILSPNYAKMSLKSGSASKFVLKREINIKMSPRSW